MEAEAEVLYCENHPTTETSLRCNRCDKLICSKCALRTPTGYRCPECVKSQQKVFDTAESRDYVLGILAAGIMSFVGGVIAQILGFWVILLAPAVAIFIANVVQNVLKGRRSKRLFQLIAASVALGALLAMSFQLLGLLLVLFSGSFQGAGGLFFSALWPGLYAVIATSTVYYRLAGIRI
jgi:hypothetical protein